MNHFTTPIISASIKYIGVNDHKIDLFEGQYIVPDGMAYNSYVILDEKIAFLYLSKEQIDMYISEDEPDIHEGLVNYGRSIEGVEVSVFIRQTGEDEYKISMRANNYANVAEIVNVLKEMDMDNISPLMAFGTLQNLVDKVKK